MKIKSLVALLMLVLAVLPAQRAEAAKGVPGSPEFGFGVTLQPDGPKLDEALNLLIDLHPDWVYVPVAWAAIQPASAVEPELAALDKIMAVAGAQKIAVAISLSQTPEWAKTDDGPNAALTAQFAALLVQRYAGTVQAFELFPRANTLKGWGSAPNPTAYLNLFQAVQDRLAEDGSAVLLVAAGLQPLGKSAADINPAHEMDDLAFLQGLYAAGGGERLQVISLQYADLSADLMASPYRDETMIFRHYESARVVMLANKHSGGLLWITGFGLPSGAYDTVNVRGDDVNQQQVWLQQAYYQVHSQLYIGAAILQSLNAAPTDPASGAVLLQPENSVHPFYQVLKQMLLENNPGGLTQRPGRSKMGNLLKNKQ